ncbi:MAG: DEAD/DEAH box helicase family protein [Candidatus Heimdallarchaeota archaeon]|nr:DEAD/DEAH box helicase family protein [Candidatus Heimdallarchaeota archaeon]
MGDNHVRVVDSVMGSGKTSFAVQWMNENPKEKFIYISPFLDEASRIVHSCPELNFREPSDEVYGTKTKHFRRLIEKNENIASTHRMFEGISSEMLDLLRVRNYRLVLDEAISVLYNYELGGENRRWSNSHAKTVAQSDVETLLEAKFISINDENLVEWTGNRLSKYDKMRDLADREVLYYVNSKALLWSFPEEVFSPDVFQSVSILSYQFNFQMMSKYLEFFNITYDKYYVEQDSNGKYFLLPFSPNATHELEFRSFLKSKIHIINSKKLNAIGDPVGKRTSSLSKTWWEKNAKNEMEALNKNLTAFFRYKTNAPASKRAWSTFVSERKKVRGKYINGKYWVPMNSRATNQYRDKRAIAYCVNRFAHPDTVTFFRKRGLELNHEEYATSEMLQFLFRFAIREGKDIDVYMPSFRMRKLLELYLDGKEPSEFKKISLPLTKESP